MKRRFVLYRRKRGGMFYLEDTQFKKQESLHTKNRADAVSVLHARNESMRQPQLNLQIAKAYLSGTDSGVTTRTWHTAIEALTNTKQGENKERWLRVVKDRALITLLPEVIIETKGETILKVLQSGTISTNVFLRRLHNFCVDMGWLPWPLVPKRQWPAVKHKDKRSITLEEHQRIIAAEVNSERKLLYQLCWHLGGSQGDIAKLNGEDVDWANNTISFFRKKTSVPVIIHLGTEALNLLKDLPGEGVLFPYLSRLRSSDRATEFGQRCEKLGIQGVTLHSYRYAWAERAKVAGYPERFAQEALGHNSKAVHRAYAKRALMKLPSLEEYERRATALAEPVA